MTPALQTLRRITETLGDTWPYTNQGHPQFQWDEPSDGFSAQDSDEDLVRWVSVLVLKPLYKAEDLTVVLRFPAVEGEVSRTVQDARHYNAKLHFPHLKVAIPQPSDETIVYLAFPASQGLAGVVCIDCTQVDGRLFATELPDYVDRRTILSHADLPPDSSTQVYVGHGRQPLSDDAWIHLFPAITITLLPSEAPPPQFHDISQLLLQGLTWSAISTFVLGTAEGVYCLVTRYSYKLFQVDASQPWRYRQGLADALDVDVQGLRIFPAMPKVHDASVEGMEKPDFESNAFPNPLDPRGGGPFEAAFLICIPGYLSETVSVTLNAPAALFDVLVLLNDARSDESRRRFPHLVETFPQPDTNFGSFVAVPDWDCMVATVLIDARPHSQWHLLHDFASQG
ncbi:hypothetical protein AK812_SmicGene26536 [Symbiodinium microadriaticum]|uniref:Uncharacterized protein n=1 Tax=Symbiodinium microadriaticum TaxID=2951 RepID=A0A1Q9D9B3_SYMMI|nr:hypothetical protein AK812_SmicGene26536 [Symbiodinium microadriaticum]CAE7275418.1 unnamed protein product [Symbiodinium sp. KB8]